MLVVVDPVLAVTGFDVEESRVVSPQAAQGWPLPSRITSRATESRRSAMFHVEEQGPAAIVTLDVAPRTPALEVARVTTVEISSGAVLRALGDGRTLWCQDPRQRASTSETALTAHLTVAADVDRDAVLAAAHDLVGGRFHVSHATIQIEGTGCRGGCEPGSASGGCAPVPTARPPRTPGP